MADDFVKKYFDMLEEYGMDHTYKVIHEKQEFTVLELAFNCSDFKIFKYFCDKIGFDQVKTLLSKKWPTKNEIAYEFLNKNFGLNFIKYFTQNFGIDLYEGTFEYNGVKGDARVLIKPTIFPRYIAELFLRKEL